MSEKNRDNKNRWRNVTIAFRMSPEENEELNLRVKLCGYQTRQEYIIESVLHQKVTAVGNPLMLVQFRKQLRGIEEELKRLTTLEDADEELFTPIRTMLEIFHFDEINSRTGKSYDNDVVVKAMLQIRDILMKSDKLKTSAKNNTQKDFEFSYFDDIDDALIEGLSQNQDFFSLLLSNEEMKRQVLGIFADEIYKSLRNTN